MISICIPTYEQKGVGAHYLTQLLYSIRTQAFKGIYEVVISDNASGPQIKDVCDRFPDLPINYHFNPQRGASENINNVIALAKYDKVKLMMQDDLFNSVNALEVYSDLLEGAGWVVADSIHIDANGRQTGKRAAKYDPTNFEDNTVGMPSVMAFKKAHMQPPYFDTRLKTFCDLYFYYKLHETYGPPEIVPHQLVAQRYHNASLSRNQVPSHKADKDLLIRERLIPYPRVVVAVVVYNRYDNIERWLHCWRQCDKRGARMVIIFNNENPLPLQQRNFSNSYALDVDVINRPNIGFDIGAFQDVCKNRLPGIPDFDYLLWCTDDTIPMQLDFITPFLTSFDKFTGVTCMQISTEHKRHVRTTGFCIRKDVAQRLQFHTDPIRSRVDCRHFEHRGGRWTLLAQVEAMRLKVTQVAPLEKSPLYDMGFWHRNEQAEKLAHLYDRMNEHNSIFNKTATLTG